MLKVRTLPLNRFIVSGIMLTMVMFISYSLSVNKVYAASCQAPSLTYINSANLTTISS